MVGDLKVGDAQHRWKNFGNRYNNAYLLFENMDPARNPTELLPHMFRVTDHIETFLNAFTLCTTHWNHIFNLLQNDDFSLQYGQIANELRQFLSHDAPEDQYQQLLRAATNDESLILALGCLTAFARHIGYKHGATLARYSQPYRSSNEFGNAAHWLALDQPGALVSSIPKRPRDIDALHATLKRYQDPLLVTPADLDEWKLTRVPVDRALENQFERRIRNRSFRVAVSPLSYEAEIAGISSPRPPPQPADAFHLTSIGPPDHQQAALIKILNDAHREQVAILVLPELRVPPELLDTAKRFLRDQKLSDNRGLLLVVAGTWHVADNGLRYNRAVLLSHAGHPLWTHDKLREYVATSVNVRREPAFFKRIGVGAAGGSEAIQRGLALEFYESVIGRVAAAICIGFFSPDVEPLLQASRANVFLVPAMTPSITDIEARAAALVRTQNAFTFSANCGRVGIEAASFCCWPAAVHPGKNINWLPATKTMLVFDLKTISTYDYD